MTTASHTSGLLPSAAAPSAGTVVSVARSPRHGFTKQPQPAILLIAGEGVEGDAHRGTTVQHRYQKRRDPSQPNLCQVHLFAAEMLEELEAKGFDLEPGELGENVLTRGLDLLHLPQGSHLQLGAEAQVEITGLRTPCSLIDRHRPGLQQHLWAAGTAPNGKPGRVRRAGIMGVVRAGGPVRPGDPIHLTLPPAPHLPLGPV